MNNKHTCGSCSYWDHAKKRNCSNPDTPVYYSQCLYPVDGMVLPHCVTFEETSAANGTNCPCFVPLAASADLRKNEHASAKTMSSTGPVCNLNTPWLAPE